MPIAYDLYHRLLDQAHAVAMYHQHLIACDLAPSDDDRDVMERAADHVVTLAGYQGVEANEVSDMLWRGLRKKMGKCNWCGMPQEHCWNRRHGTECPEFTDPSFEVKHTGEEG